MSIAIDTTSAGTKGAGVNSISWTHTVSASLSNSILTVQATTAKNPINSISTVAWNGSTTGWSKTVNSVAATQSDSDGGLLALAEFWYLLAPAAGTFTVLVTPTAGATEMTGGSASFSGVAQSSTFNAASPQKNARTGSINPTTTVTSATGEMCIDSVCLELVNIPTAVVGAGQTQITNQNNGNFTSMGLGSYEAGAATVVMDWTGLNNANNVGTGQVCVSMIPAAADDAAIPLMGQIWQ